MAICRNVNGFLVKGILDLKGTRINAIRYVLDQFDYVQRKKVEAKFTYIKETVTHRESCASELLSKITSTR